VDPQRGAIEKFGFFKKGIESGLSGLQLPFLRLRKFRVMIIPPL
jgi:hypothetical protein